MSKPRTASQDELDAARIAHRVNELWGSPDAADRIYREVHELLRARKPAADPGDQHRAARGFHWHSRAWYWNEDQQHRLTLQGVSEKINFGLYPASGGSSGELAMAWRSSFGAPLARLEVYGEAWEALAGFGDLLRELSAYRGLTPNSFVELLKRCGFRDLTRYEKPL